MDPGRTTLRYFDPWVGSAYRTDGVFGLRVLIVGESHYDSPDALKPSCTIDVVRDLGQRNRFRFFTVTQSLVLGTRGWTPDRDRAAFWERVAFCNYIQTFVGHASRISPTPEMWSAGRESFLQTVRELEPQVIVVLGDGVRDRLPELPAGIQICFARHPSGNGFRYDIWRPVVRAGIIGAGGTIPVEPPSETA